MKVSSSLQKDELHTWSALITAQLISLFISPWFSSQISTQQFPIRSYDSITPRTATGLTKIRPYRVFLTCLHWAWPSSKNWMSCCFIRVFSVCFFLFTCYFMNNITMQHYTQDHSFTRDAQSSPKRPAAQSLLCQGRYTQDTNRQTPNSQN